MKTCLIKYTEKFTTKKIENFQTKKLIYFHISAQNICFWAFCSKHRLWVLAGGSNEYPQSMFLSSNRNNNVYSYKSQFCYIKVGFKGVKIV